MRLNQILPNVELTQYEFPKKCPQQGCPGMRFLPRQEENKKIVDAQHPEVTAWRCECKTCGHVFRVYPKRVQSEANFEAREGYGCDDVNSGIELRGCRNRIGQSRQLGRM